MIYKLIDPSGLEVGASKTPIAPVDGQWRSVSNVWLEPVPGDGSHVVEEADPVEVPAEVPRSSALKVIYLELNKTKADLLLLADAMPEPAKTLTRIDIEESLVFRRNHKTVTSLAAAIGLSDAQLDALFIKAGAMQ